MFTEVTRGQLHKYRQRVATETLTELLRHPLPLRYTLLAAYCHLRQKEITDNLLELLTQIVHRIRAKAETKADKELLTDLRKIGGKTNLLFQLAEAAVAQPEGIIKTVLYPVVGEQTLKDLVREYKASGDAYRKKVQLTLRASYGFHYRRMVPAILKVLEFHSNNTSHQPVVEALNFIKKHAESKQQYYPVTAQVPMENVISTTWRELVVHTGEEDQEQINCVNYELAVLEALRDKLRVREIWVAGADRYRNPDEDLPADFEQKREEYYRALPQPLDVEVFIRDLQQKMRAGLSKLDGGMPKNEYVKIQSKAGDGWIGLTPLQAQSDPPNLDRLKAEVGRYWPMTSLLEIFKEAALRIGFTAHFKSLTERSHLEPAVLQKRLLLSIYGLGTNAGIKRLSQSETGEAYADLLYVRQRYIYKEALQNSIAQVANAIFQTRLPHIWGEATTS